MYDSYSKAAKLKLRRHIATIDEDTKFKGMTEKIKEKRMNKKDIVRTVIDLEIGSVSINIKAHRYRSSRCHGLQKK